MNRLRKWLRDKKRGYSDLDVEILRLKIWALDAKDAELSRSERLALCAMSRDEVIYLATHGRPELADSSS